MSAENIKSLILIQALMWGLAVIYDLTIGFSSILEFTVVLLVTAVLITVPRIAWLKMGIRREARLIKEEIRLEADRRIRENPNCEATRMLYGRRGTAK